MKNYLYIFAKLIFLFLAQASQAETDATTVLRKAQAALAAEDYETAYDTYQIAAQKHHSALAQFSLGLFYRNGWGRDTNNVTACQWFEKAAVQGIPVAQHFTGSCLEQGLHRTENPELAATYYQKAAEAGHYVSYCDLGRLHMAGKGIEKNAVLALELCLSPAMQGSLSAQIQMGKFLLEGDASIRNPLEAIHWFETAAQQQSSEAFYYLGMIVRQGLLQNHTPQKARQLFEQAASLKYIPAYFEAGKHFFQAESDPETGHLSAEHLAKAYLWLSAAVQRSTNKKEIAAANRMLQQALQAIPKTWLSELNSKITLFLQENR